MARLRLSALPIFNNLRWPIWESKLKTCTLKPSIDLQKGKKPLFSPLYIYAYTMYIQLPLVTYRNHFLKGPYFLFFSQFKWWWSQWFNMKLIFTLEKLSWDQQSDHFRSSLYLNQISFGILQMFSQSQIAMVEKKNTGKSRLRMSYDLAIISF